MRLTGRGRKLLNRKRALVEKKRDATYASLAPEDRERAAAVLRALAAAIAETR